MVEDAVDDALSNAEPGHAGGKGPAQIMQRKMRNIAHLGPNPIERCIKA
jgi:hypothetical protein